MGKISVSDFNSSRPDNLDCKPSPDHQLSRSNVSRKNFSSTESEDLHLPLAASATTAKAPM